MELTRDEYAKELGFTDYQSLEKTIKDNRSFSDRLAELEKVVLDFYLTKGFVIGSGRWSFSVAIHSYYKYKALTIFFHNNGKSDVIEEFRATTTKDMFDKAVKFYAVDYLNQEFSKEKPEINPDEVFKKVGYSSEEHY